MAYAWIPPIHSLKVSRIWFSNYGASAQAPTAVYQLQTKRIGGRRAAALSCFGRTLLDVFLDTLSVRAADAFQEQLWHRMTDSDVVVLLYTNSIHASGWVEQEIERASGMKVTVLQIIWPGVKRDPKTTLFEPLYLSAEDFDSTRPATLTTAKVEEICTLVEKLRARSLANREAELVGTLRDRAAFHKLTTTVQRTRCVDVNCSPDRFTRIIPVIGVPDSESFEAGALTPSQGVEPKEIFILYDSLNIAPPGAII